MRWCLVQANCVSRHYYQNAFINLCLGLPPVQAALIAELFSLQDLNSDGFLDEEELVKLNEKIAMLHYGRDIDRTPTSNPQP